MLKIFKKYTTLNYCYLEKNCNLKLLGIFIENNITKLLVLQNKKKESIIQKSLEKSLYFNMKLFFIFIKIRACTKILEKVTHTFLFFKTFYFYLKRHKKYKILETFKPFL